MRLGTVTNVHLTPFKSNYLTPEINGNQNIYIQNMPSETKIQIKNLDETLFSGLKKQYKELGNYVAKQIRVRKFAMLRSRLS